MQVNTDATSTAKGLTLKQKLQRRVSQMKAERESFDTHWKELSQFIQPRRGRFFIEDRNKGDKRHQAIINSKATRAARVATAGMLAGVMSPSRPWFKLATQDRQLMEDKEVKLWLWQVEQQMYRVFAESNLYNMTPVMFNELLIFGTGLMTHVPDYEDVARFYAHTVGSYYIAQNERYVVDTMAREFQWTVEQVVSAFGLENASQFVKTAYDQGNYDTWVPLMHCVYPNKNRDYNSPLAKDKAFSSVYFEPYQGEKDKLLSVSGFKRFPGYALRWGVTGEDVYGTDCPGMIALGDTKMLQQEEKRKLQAIDKQVAPPLHGPTSLRNSPSNPHMPGGLVTYDMTGSEGQGLRAVYDVKADLNALKEDLLRVERRIDDSFYVDLWLAISNMEGVQPRNEFELSQRNQERLLQVGPVLERLNNDFLDPLIDNTFEDVIEAGIVPDPPQALQGRPLKTDYISSMALAQRATATSGIERTAAFVGGLVKAGLSDGKKFDADQAIDEYADINGNPPNLIRSDDEVAAQRQAEQQQQQQAMQAQMGEMQASALGNVAGAAQKGADAMAKMREAMQPQQQGGGQ